MTEAEYARHMGRHYAQTNGFVPQANPGAGAMSQYLERRMQAVARLELRDPHASPLAEYKYLQSIPYQMWGMQMSKANGTEPAFYSIAHPYMDAYYMPTDRAPMPQSIGNSMARSAVYMGLGILRDVTTPGVLGLGAYR